MSNDVIWRGAVTGLSFRSYGRYIAELKTGTELELRRDRANEHDSNAVGVWFQGKQIGWIPKFQNAQLAWAMDKGKEVQAVITNHDTSADFSKRLFINVYPADLSEDEDDDDDDDDPNLAQIQNGRIIPSKTARMSGPRTNTQQLPKENTMLNKIIESNKSAIKSAGYLEAGRMANTQVAKLASKKLPMMLRGYADTAIGRLVIANLAQMAAAQFKPNNQKLAKITEAMVVESYTQVIQEFDLDGMMEELLKSATMTKAMKVLDAAPGDDAAA